MLRLLASASIVDRAVIGCCGPCLQALFARLDALSHFHFAPKPVVEDMAVRAEVPALALEEVAPQARPCFLPLYDIVTQHYWLLYTCMPHQYCCYPSQLFPAPAAAVSTAQLASLDCVLHATLSCVSAGCCASP